MAINIGIDLGSVSVKVAAIGDPEDYPSFYQMCGPGGAFSLITREMAPSFAGRPIALSRYRRFLGNPIPVTSELLEEIYHKNPGLEVAGIRATGSGGKLLSQLLGVGFENEFKAIARAVGIIHPEVRTIFEMGGETSKFIRLERDEATGATGIVDYETNGDCAAGTGSFIDQQAVRLRYQVEEVGEIAAGAKGTARIAGRCSVFAKSDMVHAQQKGYQPPEILKGLCEAVARNFKGAITKGKKVEPRVAFIGGLAMNKGVARALQDLFQLRDEDFFVPEYYAWFGAMGAALEQLLRGNRNAPRDIHGLWRHSDKRLINFPTYEPLSLNNVLLLRDRVEPYHFKSNKERINTYLGVDVGSVSTNLALIDEQGELVKEIYLRTEGRPIEVGGAGLKEIQEELGDRIRILGVGTTGSGRELIGELVGADTVNDEITAHKTGAMYIGKKLLGERVDTIFEVGGQDSKFISIEDGIVVDFAMNEACAAGTGSFLEEQAERLGVSIKGEFSELALLSEHPIRLGERCTVFMEQDVNAYQHKGAEVRDLVAGLAYSIALNYLNRVVRGRKIGEVIYFQGGTAYNDSVAAAFAKLLGKRIVVPPHNGVVGAIGMALLAQEKMAASGLHTRFRGFDLKKVNYTIREFTCKACPNQCDMQEFTVEGVKTYWGDKCSDRFRKRAKVDRGPVIPDLVALRERLLLEGYEGPKGLGPRVGMPRSMFFYEYFPFWRSYLEALGCAVVLSEETNRRIGHEGIDLSVAEPCFPIIVAHGHIKDLLDKGVDWVFQPNMMNAEAKDGDLELHFCPWAQTLPFVLRSVPRFEGFANRFLAPTIHFRLGREKVKKQLRPLAKKLGLSGRLSDRAVEAAYSAQTRFRQRLQKAGQEAMRILEEKGEPGIVLVGRSYNVSDRGVNLNIPSKLRDYYGVNVIPMDFLSIEEINVRDINPNMYWNSGHRILAAAKIVSRYPKLHIIYITNFKCGPDSYIKHFTGPASGKPFLTLQFDGHGNDAGYLTRCEAYLDSKGVLRWWKEKRKTHATM
ncbi:MAG: hypothetical protein HY998_02615 [candidate division NC10 bacterium]|nr:hypothetical protein [candidate division NC10 bacterium]